MGRLALQTCDDWLALDTQRCERFALRIMDVPSFSPRDFLFTLLLKVGVAASIGALLARWNTFRRVLFTEERDVDQKIRLGFFMVPPLILGVTLRLVGTQYRFADLSLEGAFLMGLLGGRVVGPIGGAIITIPTLIAHEWLGMPVAATAGLIGGLMRQAIPHKEELWNFRPFTFLNIPKDVVKFIRKVDIPWEMLPFGAFVGLELGRGALVAATAGLIGGLMRQAIPNKEELWNFGPFTFLNIPKAVVKFIRKVDIPWEMLPLGACVGLELGRVALVAATKPKQAPKGSISHG